jgi:single-strand DNA-binding protein
MRDINTTVLVGRLTKDAEVRFTSGGMAVAGISLAVNGSKKVGDSYEDVAHFFDCTILGKRAEGLKPYLVKGQQVVIEGALQQERWQAQDGSNRSKVVILIDNLQLVGGNKGQAQQSQGETQQYDDEVPF